MATLVERLRKRYRTEPSFVDAPRNAVDLPDEDCHEAANEIDWLRSSLVSLLTLAEGDVLTNSQVAAICKVALNRHVGN